MDDAFKVFIEQLRDGEEKRVDEEFDPSFLDLDEEDLAFEKPVLLEGHFYIAEKELVINWNIEALAKIPCAICNEAVEVPVLVRNFYHCEPLANIKSGVYNFKDLLRETILLEVPKFAECNRGSCPHRSEVAQFLKKPLSETESDEEGGYHPFVDIDWK